LRLFTDVLRDIRRGRVVDAASVELAAVTRAVMATGKPGSVTVTIEIKPQSKHDNALIVSAKVNAKEPHEELPAGIFFASAEGDLLREDPTQQRMFADAETGEIREAI
jgi:hypothetical protein